MSLVPLTSIIPPGGYVFTDDVTGVPVKIEGTSYEDLAERVLKHRLVNQRPPGNPYDEIITRLCNSHPHFCRENHPTPAPNQALVRHASIAVRVAAWISEFFKTNRSDTGLGPAETERRANICADCVYNVPISGCGSCVANVDRLFFVWRRDRNLPREDRLRSSACQILGQHNGAAVLAKSLPPVDEKSNSFLPRACWRKTV